jgi:hypothetical protein
MSLLSKTTNSSMFTHATTVMTSRELWAPYLPHSLKFIVYFLHSTISSERGQGKNKSSRRRRIRGGIIDTRTDTTSWRYTTMAAEEIPHPRGPDPLGGFFLCKGEGGCVLQAGGIRVMRRRGTWARLHIFCCTITTPTTTHPNGWRVYVKRPNNRTG